MDSRELLDLYRDYSARNYAPLPVVLSSGRGVWLKDVEGNDYLDMLSAYSAVNFGHSHPKILQALIDQASRLALTSRAFHNDRLAPFLKAVCELTDMEMALPMNTGVEAVETAIKAARKWGYLVKGVPDNTAEIITFNNNFHGRTIAVISFSSEKAYREGFGPFAPGFRRATYGYIEEVEELINDRTVAILFEPIQGEGGIIVPTDDFLRGLRNLCTKHNILLIADEIQTGLGRTGAVFACDHPGVVPDMYILGKALGGGVYPVSMVSASKEVLGVFNPGDHGSTFGGNPLACAVGMVALELIKDPALLSHVCEVGGYFIAELQKLRHPDIDHIRGKGLLIGIVLKNSGTSAKNYCKLLLDEGLLCKETHETVIRFAPPLVITKQEIDWALTKISKVFA